MKHIAKWAGVAASLMFSVAVSAQQAAQATAQATGVHAERWQLNMRQGVTETARGCGSAS
jgi:hypothetical protein